MHSAQSLNILNGNMFACGYGRGALPLHDPNQRTYQCGSNSFDQSIVAWGVLFVVSLVSCVLLFFSNTFYLRRFETVVRIADFCIRTRAKMDLWMAIYRTDNIHCTGTNKFVLLDQNIGKLRCTMLGLTTLILVLFLPTFAALSSLYPAISQQYAWYVSAAYLRGTTPGIVVAVLSVAFTSVLLYLMPVAKSGEAEQLAKNESTADDGRSRRRWIRLGLLTLFGAVNGAVMVVVNGCYVYITLTYGTEVIVVAQVCMALFKLLWNDVALRWMLRSARRYYLPQDTTGGQNSLINSQRKLEESTDMPFLSSIILFNSILAPCLANAAVSPDCFKNVLVTVPNVTSTVPYKKCSAVEIHLPTYKCLTFTIATVSTSYAPPFLYNYQCSSSFVATYASVYVYMYLFVAFVKPAFIVLVARLFSSCDPASRLHRLLDSSIYTLLRPNRDVRAESAFLFHKEPFVLRLVGKISILMTFGVMFPPLAVVICVALVADTYTMQLMIGYFLTSISDEQTRRQCVLQLERDCQGVGEEQNYDSGLVILFAALFYAFFVFDIYGDAAGWRGAIVLSLIVVLIPTIIWAVRMSSLQRRVMTMLGISGGGVPDEPISTPIDVDMHNPLQHFGGKSTGREKGEREARSSEMVRMSSASQVF
jgi:hypothetical protein